VIWDLEPRSRLADRPLLIDADVLDVAFSPDCATVAAAYARGDKGGVALWDTRLRTRLAGTPLEITEGTPVTAAYSADGKTLAAGFTRTAGEGGVVLWDARQHTRLTERPLIIAKGGNVFGVTFNPDGSSIAVEYRRSPLVSGVALFDARRYLQLADRSLKDGESLLRVFFSPDGKTLAAGRGHFEDRADGGVAIWDARGLAPLADRPLAVAGAVVSRVAFSPDGSTIAATVRSYGQPYGGPGVVLWDAKTGQRLADRPYDIAGGFERDVTFSPDCRTLAVAYESFSEHGVVLWDVQLRRRLAKVPLEVAEGSMTSLTFSPDGKILAVGHRNMDWDVGGFRVYRGGVLLFDLDPESWKERASRIANRNFTREEWRLYCSELPYHATFDKLPVPRGDQSSPTQATEPGRGTSSFFRKETN
jgi:WD40 repeat protein